MTKQGQQYIYMERWALDAFQAHMGEYCKNKKLEEIDSSDEKRTLRLKNSRIVLKEWNPDDDNASSL